MTDQQELFAIEYARTGNATQSALTAGYSKSTAESQCSRLLGIVEVQEKIKETKAQMAQELRERMAREASTAFDVLTSIMNDTKAKEADRIKCAVEVLDRAGFITESKVNLEADVSDNILRLEIVKASDDEGAISS